MSKKMPIFALGYKYILTSSTRHGVTIGEMSQSHWDGVLSHKSDKQPLNMRCRG